MASTKPSPSSAAEVSQSEPPTVEETVVIEPAEPENRPTIRTVPSRLPESRDTIREMRLVANSISQVVLKSHTQKKLLAESKIHLALSTTATGGCLLLSLMSTSVVSLSYVLGVGSLLTGVFFGFQFTRGLQRCREIDVDDAGKCRK